MPNPTPTINTPGTLSGNVLTLSGTYAAGKRIVSALAVALRGSSILSGTFSLFPSGGNFQVQFSGITAGIQLTVAVGLTDDKGNNGNSSVNFTTPPSHMDNSEAAGLKTTGASYWQVNAEASPDSGESAKPPQQ
jgi:hypothetical protein